MTCFPMMKMTKDKEVSALQITMLVYSCNAGCRDALYKSESILGVLWGTAGVVNVSVRIRKPVIGTWSVH